MIAVAAGVLMFLVAFAAWRWGLRNRNWVEGGLFALVAGTACGVTVQAVLKV
jgi:hypothetical protein